MPLKRTIQVRISRGEQQFVAECLDLPVVTQARTLDELTENIGEVIGLHLEGEDMALWGLRIRRFLPRWNSKTLRDEAAQSVCWKGNTRQTVTDRITRKLIEELCKRFSSRRADP